MCACVALSMKCLQACRRLLYFFFILFTVLNSLLSSFLPLCVPNSSISLAKLSSVCFQYLFIRAHFAGSLYSWSHTCLRIATAVVGLLVNNLRTSLDRRCTKELKLLLICKFTFRGLSFGILTSSVFLFSDAFSFSSFFLSRYRLDLCEK